MMLSLYIFITNKLSPYINSYEIKQVLDAVRTYTEKIKKIEDSNQSNLSINNTHISEVSTFTSTTNNTIEKVINKDKAISFYEMLGIKSSREIDID